MTIICGDCLEEMRKMEDNSISAIVTDPPYGLGFMGKKWDVGLPENEIWTEALRIVKPGGHLLAFGGTRTYHRLTCAVEDAGWEIRDCIMWIYGTGFPKSHNHFGLEGYGSALKPAYEPIIMAMKKCDGTFKQNAEKWGQAGINIEESRIMPTPHDAKAMERVNSPGSGRFRAGKFGVSGVDGFKDKSEPYNTTKGRWPANVILDEEAGEMLDERSGFSISRPEKRNGVPKKDVNCYHGGWKQMPGHLNDSGGASRFFYCAKASSSERNEGLEDLDYKVSPYSPDASNGEGLRLKGNISSPRKNNHPTVKPLKLMEYLIKLIMPPKYGLLLDPFAGSGTTILAAHRLGMKALGIEKEQEYCDIANARLAYHIENNLKCD